MSEGEEHYKPKPDEASWLSEYPERSGTPEDIARIDKEYEKAAKDPATVQMKELIWGPGGTHKAYEERIAKELGQPQAQEQEQTTDAAAEGRQQSKADRPLRRQVQRALAWLRRRR